MILILFVLANFAMAVDPLVPVWTYQPRCALGGIDIKGFEDIDRPIEGSLRPEIAQKLAERIGGFVDSNNVVRISSLKWLRQRPWRDWATDMVIREEVESYRSGRPVPAELAPFKNNNKALWYYSSQCFVVSAILLQDPSLPASFAPHIPDPINRRMLYDMALYTSESKPETWTTRPERLGSYSDFWIERKHFDDDGVPEFALTDAGHEDSFYYLWSLYARYSGPPVRFEDGVEKKVMGWPILKDVNGTCYSYDDSSDRYQYRRCER